MITSEQTQVLHARLRFCLHEKVSGRYLNRYKDIGTCHYFGVLFLDMGGIISNNYNSTFLYTVIQSATLS